MPSILAAFLYYLLAKLFLFVFRVKNPSAKFIIYSLVLYKAFLVLLSGARYSHTQVPRKSFGFGNTFHDPLDLIPLKSLGPIREISDRFIAVQSSFFVLATSIVLLTILFLLVLRWLATAWFFNKAVKVANEPGSFIEQLTESLSLKLNVTRPKVVISKEDIGPMVIGILKPVIVLPEKIVNSLSKKEMVAIIGHELAHIKRKDNLWQWIILFMKDLLLLNPFARITYNAIQSNKEIAADTLFIKTLPGNSSLLKETLRKVINIKGASASYKGLIAKSNFLNSNLTQYRLYYSEKVSQIRNTWLLRTSSAFCILLFLWIKMWVAIKVSSHEALLLLS